MTSKEAPFKEANLRSTPIRDLGLTIEGTALEPVVAEFEQEVLRAGIRKLRPKPYLTTEWGVPFGTIAIGIPFYLARPELTALHVEQTGHVEGFDRTDILRYLRHEMGHVVNYGYRLYDQEEWVKHFGSITQPYLEDYRPKPFSRRYVLHLPGYYAQKHPDEDWAETFAVWMTPGLNWREEYDGWPTALEKLNYCDRTMANLGDREPVVTATDLDEDVGDLAYTLEHFYQNQSGGDADLPPGLDGALRVIFEEGGRADATPSQAKRKPASTLIHRLERELLANVYRWTGHFPERTRGLLRHLAARADDLKLIYGEDREARKAVALTTLVTALAMNYVHSGSYYP